MLLTRYKHNFLTGKHKCSCCGKDFGMDYNEAVALCQEQRYQEYLKSQNIFFIHYPCFEDFHEGFNENDKDILDYLKINKIEYKNNEAILSPYRRKEPIETECKPKSFNRVLTKEEWVNLNSTCKQNRCFSYDTGYQWIERDCKNFKDAGYDVKLKYNCPDCCEKGKHEIEFWFRFNKNYDYVVSHWRDTTSSNYRDVLEFLNGCSSYRKLLSKIFKKDNSFVDEELYVEKELVDALDRVVGTKNRYSKKDLIEYANRFYNIIQLIWENSEEQTKDLNQMIETARGAFNIFNEIISSYADSYMFSIGEYFNLVQIVAKLWTLYKKNMLSFSAKTEIVQKKALLYLKNINCDVESTTVYEYLNCKYPSSETIINLLGFSNIAHLKDMEHIVASFKKDDFFRNIIFSILNMIFDIYGQDFKINIRVLEKLSSIFDDLYLYVRLDEKHIQKLKNLMLTKKYVKGLVEESMIDIDNILKEYIMDSIDKKHLPFVLNGSIPVVWFGDIKQYLGSDIKILTIGLNPSYREFMTKNAEELPYGQKRFEELYFYKSDITEELQKMKETLNNYFKENPYEWFKKNNKLLNVLDCSYGCKYWDKEKNYKNTAIHIDIYSAIATSPTWGKLSVSQKEQLKNLQLFKELFNILSPDIVLGSVNQKVIEEVFHDWKFFTEYKFNGNNYIKVYSKNNQILINGTNMRGVPFGGIKEDEAKKTIAEIVGKIM